MAIQLKRLLDARPFFPAGLQCIIDDVSHTTDDVHRFVRILSGFECMVKLICAAMHGAARESHPGSWYGTMLKRQFIEKDPTLGVWTGSAAQIRKRIANNVLLAPLVEELWKNRAGKLDGDKVSDVFKMCRVIGASRTFVTEVPKSNSYNYISAFEIVVNLRNAFAHGALTIRFAQRFGQPVADALAEIATNLNLGEKWEFVIPLNLDPADRNCAIAMICDVYGLGDEQCHPKRFEIGDRYLQWEKLYLNHRGAKTLESAIILEPLVRFERSHRDYQFFNRFDSDDLTGEYLSYRSGDFDFDPAFEDWTLEFGSQEPDEPDVSTDIDDSIDVEAIDDALVARLLEYAREGAAERSLKFCRIRFHKALDEMDAVDQRDIFTALDAKIAETHSANLYGVLGNVIRDFGLYDLAVPALEQAIKISPKDVFTRQSLGHAELQLGISEKEVGKAESDSDRILKGRKLIESAKRTLKASLTNSSNATSSILHNVRSLSMLVDAHCRLGEFEKALKWCDEGLKVDPQNSRLLDQKEFLVSKTTTG